MFDFDLQLFGGGGGKGGGESSTTSQYQMSPEERRAKELANQVAETFVSGSKAIGNQYSNAVQSQDFINLLNEAGNSIRQGQSGIALAANGELNPIYQQNMADSLRTGVNSTIGSAINSLGNRGVLNSSVTNKALNDVSANVADSMTKAYMSNLGQQAGLSGNLINTANAGYIPYQTLLALGQGGSGMMNQAANLYTGTGTKTQTQTEEGAGFGDMLGAGLMGLGTSWIKGQMGLR